MPFSFHFTSVRSGKINTCEGIVRYKFESCFSRKKKFFFILCIYFYISFAPKNSYFIYLRDINVYVYISLFFHYIPKVISMLFCSMRVSILVWLQYFSCFVDFFSIFSHYLEFASFFFRCFIFWGSF